MDDIAVASCTLWLGRLQNASEDDLKQAIPELVDSRRLQVLLKVDQIIYSIN